MALVPCQVLRAAILLSYCSILCNYKAIDMPAHQTYGGSWKFLTFIDLNHRMVWVEKDLCAGSPTSRPGFLELHQPGLECLQGWGIHSLLGQPVPVLHHPLPPHHQLP
uniref:Androgen induced 1 n=1 Tax=Gallus gallus TaxID=9031 RepID=A0A8V0XVN8_CHICK